MLLQKVSEQSTIFAHLYSLNQLNKIEKKNILFSIILIAEHVINKRKKKEGFTIVSRIPLYL